MCLITQDCYLNPKSKNISSEKPQPQRQESPYIVFAYGVVPSNIHYRQIPSNFTSEGIKKIACGAEHIMFLTYNNFVLTCGNNKFGQCARLPEAKGEGTREDEKEGDEVTQDDILEDNYQVGLSAFNIDNHTVIIIQVEDIAAGAYHSLLLVKTRDRQTSKVMAFGHELGCGFLDKQHKHLPTEIEIEVGGQRVNENVMKIFAGHNRTGVLLEDGRLLMWGEWFNGAKQRRMKEIRANLDSNDKIKKVAIGKMHALMVSENGKVYTWGDNTYGELGLGRSIKGKDAPTLLREGFDSVNAKFLDVAAGARHSLVLEENGRIFSFGDNSEGQCGIENSRSYQPVEIHTRGLLGEEGVKTRFIYAGDAHSAVVTSEGDMFAWGDNSAGRLGIKTSASVFRPTLVDDLMGRNIINVGLGGFFSIAVVGPAQYSLIHRNENLLIKQLFKHLIKSTTLALPIGIKPQL